MTRLMLDRGNPASRRARESPLPCPPTRRTRNAASWAVFMPSISKPSDFSAMSSPNQPACSAASAWQYALNMRPR